VTEPLKVRARALGAIIAEDLAQALGVGVDELGEAWTDFADAVACNVYAEGRLERMAATGAVAHTAAHLP